MEPPLTVLAVTRRRKEVSRILQLWMALQSSMETLNGMRTQERRKSTTLWWNRRAWLHLRIEEDNEYWIKEISQLSKCTLGSNIVLFTFVHCLCIWCYLFSFFLSLIGLIYFHGMPNNIIFYRVSSSWQLQWYNSIYKIYDSFKRKYLAGFNKETASSCADLVQGLFAWQKPKVLSCVNHP